MIYRSGLVFELEFAHISAITRIQQFEGKLNKKIYETPVNDSADPLDMS